MNQSERRCAVRARCLYGGRIAYGKGHLSLDCTVRNLSPGGALLSFRDGASIPDRFELIVAPLGKPVPARIVWRRGTRHGVAFGREAHDGAPLKPSPLALAERLRAC